MGLPIKPRITISKTPKEWEYIELKLKEVSKNDIHSYLNNEIQKITNRFIADPDSLPMSLGGKSIQFTINPYTYMVMNEISKKMEKSIHSIIEEFIILPLILPKP